MIKDFATKPLNNGKAEIDMAPMMQKIVVKGMYLYRPPNSEAYVVPALYKTAPMLIKSKALYMI